MSWAAILGSIELREYLINFARSFIYTYWAFRLILLPDFGCVLQLRKQKNNIELRKH
jgi:hypothetical protein